MEKPVTGYLVHTHFDQCIPSNVAWVEGLGDTRPHCLNKARDQHFPWTQLPLQRVPHPCFCFHDGLEAVEAATGKIATTSYPLFIDKFL